MPCTAPAVSAGCAALGSRIYIFAGRFPSKHSYRDTHSADTFYLDTRHPYKGWKVGPKMNSPKAWPTAVVSDGKVYAFASHACRTEPYLEILDPVLGGWLPVPDPPYSLSGGHAAFAAISVLDDDGEKKILCSFAAGAAAFCFRMKDRSWELFDRNFGYWESTPVVVGRTLFCYGALPDPFAPMVRLRSLHAYDLVQRRWFQQPVKGLESEGVLPPLFSHAPTPTWLFRLNEQGKLCLVWADRDYLRDSYLHVHCTKFTISFGGFDSFRAVIESFNIYPFWGSKVVNFIVMNFADIVDKEDSIAPAESISTDEGQKTRGERDEEENT